MTLADQPTLRRFLGLVLTGLTLMMAGGCAPLLESDQPSASTWWLEPTRLDLSAISGDARPLSLSVTVVPGLDSNRMLTLDPEARLDHVAGAHWADHLPELVTSLVTRSLEGAPRFPAISRNGYRRGGECLLALEVRAFQVQLDADQVARSVSVEIAGLYRCDDTHRVLRLSANTPVVANRVPLIVEAFQAAFDDNMRQLVEALADTPP